MTSIFRPNPAAMLDQNGPIMMIDPDLRGGSFRYPQCTRDGSSTSSNGSSTTTSQALADLQTSITNLQQSIDDLKNRLEAASIP